MNHKHIGREPDPVLWGGRYVPTGRPGEAPVWVDFPARGRIQPGNAQASSGIAPKMVAPDGWSPRRRRGQSLSASRTYVPAGWRTVEDASLVAVRDASGRVANAIKTGGMKINGVFVRVTVDGPRIKTLPDRGKVTLWSSREDLVQALAQGLPII